MKKRGGRGEVVLCVIGGVVCDYDIVHVYDIIVIAVQHQSTKTLNKRSSVTIRCTIFLSVGPPRILPHNSRELLAGWQVKK